MSQRSRGSQFHLSFEETALNSIRLQPTQFEMRNIVEKFKLQYY